MPIIDSINKNKNKEDTEMWHWLLICSNFFTILFAGFFALGPDMLQFNAQLRWCHVY